jgi:hypothetical protein
MFITHNEILYYEKRNIEVATISRRNAGYKKEIGGGTGWRYGFLSHYRVGKPRAPPNSVRGAAISLDIGEQLKLVT